MWTILRLAHVKLEKFQLGLPYLVHIVLKLLVQLKVIKTCAIFIVFQRTRSSKGCEVSGNWAFRSVTLPFF